ncbi:hypothetical protein A0256_03890 [Mucilaginibacter sp. PAMC 26640]|nr:hypothetical protein A0256_03890 [Mucilaginibacter sp. PAMC 26640]
MSNTKLGISETTLKRLYGFAESKFNPSLFTLNALAVFCGYIGWDAFCQLHLNAVSIDSSADVEVLKDPLLQLLLETPVATVVLKANAPDFTILAQNSAYLEATNTANREITGLTLWEVFSPKNAGGLGPTLLLEAFHEAIYSQKIVEMKPLQYNIPSALPNMDSVCWWDMRIVPVIYSGVCKYLVVNTKNITERMVHQDAIEQAIMKELTMAEDLASTNVKLSAALENITESHDELIRTKGELEALNRDLEQRVFERSKKLFQSEAKQRKLIDNAPVAIAFLRGPDYIIEIANKKIMDYWGKINPVINKPLTTAVPELRGQSFIRMLDEVRTSGKPYSNPELRAMLIFDGILQPRYYDMVYQPIQLVPGITDSIYVVAIDITEHVIARQKLEESETILRLAVSAANIGIWSFNMKYNTVKYNPMFAKITGWDREYPMPYEKGIEQVTAEYRQAVIDAINKAVDEGGQYDIIYCQKRFNDGKLVWLRAIGKVSSEEPIENKAFSGILMEIPPPLQS